jgi:N utilization substance protein B
MKSLQDPRHKRRERIVKALFNWAFQPKMKTEDKFVAEIIKSQPRADKLIAKAAPEWPIEQINRIDLAILRLAVYELALNSKEPPKVVIDEAVELAKTFGGEKSPSFVNGVLGTVFKQINKGKKNAKSS